MRSWGEDIPRVWQAVGAVLVTVLPGEFSEGLQRGSVDCMLLSWDLLASLQALRNAAAELRGRTRA